MITGSVLYRQRLALPPGSIVCVQLEDVSRQDAPAELVAESQLATEGEQVPIPFELDTDPSMLDPRASYALRATIEIDGALAFATTTAHRLSAGGAATGIDLVVEPARAAAKPLEGTWQLVELDGEPVPPAGAVRAPHLVFDAEETRVSGSGGCNRLAGSFELSGDELRFGPLAVTRMACADDVMRREDVFLRALGSVTRHDLDGATLALYAGERVVARLTEQSQA